MTARLDIEHGVGVRRLCLSNQAIEILRVGRPLPAPPTPRFADRVADAGNALAPCPEPAAGDFMARDDFELLESWRKGDRAAAERLVGRHFRTLYRFFARRAASDAEDLTQQTLLACVEARDRLRGEASFRTYLYAVARRQLHGRHRLMQRPHPGELDSAALSVADQAASARAQLVRREDECLLGEALQRIPHELKTAIVLAYWEDLSAAEIAGVLEIPTNTAYSRIRRARLALRAELERLGVNPSDRNPGTR